MAVQEPIRTYLPITQLVPFDGNPNKMTEREFDLLIDNFEKMGVTDPVLVWPIDLKLFLSIWKKHRKAVVVDDVGGPAYDAFEQEMVEQACFFKIVGGHHRTEAAKYLELVRMPCTINVDPEFDQEQAEIQLMRHNMIKGHQDPQKFFTLYEKYLSNGYADDMVQELFGFADASEFKKLIDQSAATLPKELQDKFKEAAKEVKTIDGLAKLLNHMFTMYGDTLPYGYMVLDHGGQQSIWLRIENKKTWDSVTILGQTCIEKNRSVDDVLGYILQALANGSAGDLVKGAFENTPEVVIPDGFIATPTKDNLSKIAQ